MNSSSPMTVEVEDENFGSVAALKACLWFPATPDGHLRGLVRTLVVVLAHPGVTAACPDAMSAKTPAASSSSRRNVRWNRSALPVVAGAASRWVIPLSRQIRSNSTSPPLPNRSVNCLPLSVRISSGIPKQRMARISTRHTARPVARGTTEATTQYRAWSSTPVTTFASTGSPWPEATNTPPTMSICHNAIAVSRSHRRYSLGLRRGLPANSPCRTSIRCTVVRDGGGPGNCSSSRWASISCTSRTDPHRGCALVAAPRTYLRQTTEDPLQRFAPEVPRKPVQGRDVPVALHRAITQLGFKATTALEDLDPDLPADLDELDT